MSRIHALAVAGVLALGATACAPTTVDQTASTPASEEPTDGTLRVWLFSEVAQDPKSAVVDAAVEDFEGSHEGVEVEVQYIPVEARAERFTAAFNDPASAPDVAEVGNTDLAGYVANGGLADLSEAIEGWEEAADLDEAALATTEVDGASYAVPWFVGVRALYYRTDVFAELGLQPPTTLAEIAETARAIRAARPEMVGIAAGGAYQFAAMPYIWANGGELAEESGGEFTGALDSPEARAGVAAYTELVADDICPPQTCAEWGGNASVQAFSAGGAGMTFGGDFSYKGVQESAVGADFAVVPTPGVEAGSIAPAFAGGNDLVVFNSSERQALAGEFVQLLAGKDYQRQMFDAMGNLPTMTDVREEVAETNPETQPFIATLEAGTEFVPVTPAWSQVDADAVVPGMLQSIVTGAADVDAATATATEQMNSAFAGQ